MLFVQLYHIRKVAPTTCGNKAFAVYCGFNFVKVAFLDVQISKYGGMYAFFIGVLLPYIVIRLNINALKSIPSDDVKLAHRVVVLRRVTCCHNNPTIWYTVPPENLILKKLQHGRSQGFGHAVYFIQKQDSFFQPCAFHHVVNRSDYLAHGILGHAIHGAAVSFLFDKWQTQGTLAGMVSHGVADQAHTQFTCYLLHNSGFTDARRSHKKNRTLPFNGYKVTAELIFGKVCPHGILNLFFSLLDVHKRSANYFVNLLFYEPYSILLDFIFL